MLDNSVDGTLRTAKHHAHITDTEQPVHDLIALSAIKSPDSVAVKCDGVSLTYAELETRSNQLARRLQADGVALGDLVGICIERSVEMLVGLLGTLKAGGTYVPIDPAYPADRVAYMLEDSGAKYVLTQGALKSGLAQVGANLLALDDDWASILSMSSPDQSQKFPNHQSFDRFACDRNS